MPSVPLILTLSLLAPLETTPATVAKAQLVYERDAGAEDCPVASGVRAAVKVRLGYDPFDEAATRVVRARLWRGAADGVRHARVEVLDDGREVGGERELASEGPTCADLESSLALAVSMAIDPLRASAAPPQPPRTPPPTRIVYVPTAIGAPVRAADVSYHAAVGGGVVTDSSRGAADLAIDLEGGMRYGATSLALGARALSFDAGASGSARVAVSQLGATIIPCFHRRGGAACALIGAGVVRGRGYGFPDPRTALEPWVAFGGRLAWTLDLTRRVGLRAGVDAVANLARVRFAVDGNPLWETPPFTIAGMLAGLVRFP